MLEVTVMLAGVVSCLFSGRRYGGTCERERSQVRCSAGLWRGNDPGRERIVGDRTR